MCVCICMHTQSPRQTLSGYQRSIRSPSFMNVRALDIVCVCVCVCMCVRACVCVHTRTRTHCTTYIHTRVCCIDSKPKP